MLTIKFFEKQINEQNPTICSVKDFDNFINRLKKIQQKKLYDIRRDYVILSRYFLKIRKFDFSMSKYIQHYIQSNREVFFG